MSEQLQKQLEEAQNIIKQVNARLSANEQIANGVLKDLVETKTNLNLYIQAFSELTNKATEDKVAHDLAMKKLNEDLEGLKKEKADLSEFVHNLMMKYEPQALECCSQHTEDAA